MATLHVGAEMLVNVRPHPNADSLDLANIGSELGYQVVLPKGQYKDGSMVIYIPEGALVPQSILEQLGLVGKLSGKLKNVVRAVRLRGEISQGLVWVPEGYSPTWWINVAADRTNLARSFGITKFVPEVPVHMAGEQEPAPDMLGWVEIENIKKYPRVIKDGELVTITEKLHGTCVIFCYQVADDVLQVSSKGLAAQHLAIKESDTNLYWRVAHAYKIKSLLRTLARQSNRDVTRVAIYGEVFGEGVQDLTYGATGRGEKPGFAAFDLRVTTDTEDYWCPVGRLLDLLPIVPILYAGEYSREKVAELTDGPEQVSHGEKHMREGVVVRLQVERTDPGIGGRVILKSVSDAYLTRKKGDKGVTGTPTELQ